MIAAGRAGPPRIVLHTGKGGVGKTTVATATAVGAARAGHRTLLLSTDPAHSVADVLGLALGPDPVPVPDFEGVVAPGAGRAGQLWAAQVDVRGRLEAAWSSIRGYLTGVLAARGMAAVQAEELTVLPGADEVVALLEIGEYAGSGEFDVIVVDCAPTGETLRLLALPETLAFYSARLMGTPARLLRTLAAGLGRSQSAAGAPGAEVKDALGELLAKLAAVRNLLADPTIGGIRLVVTPERVVVAEARRLWTALSLHGFAVEAVVVNRVLPERARGEFVNSWRASQRIGLAAVDESFGALAQFRLELLAAEPIGVEALREVADLLFGGSDPMSARAAVDSWLSVEETDAGYRLRLSLQLVQRGDIELGRSGDDLVVTIGAQRRRLTLPSLLRRCSAVDARLVDGDLLIDFVPDASLWPAALNSTAVLA